jgi:hypothetical protein
VRLTDEVRRTCAAIAASAGHVRVVPAAGAAYDGLAAAPAPAPDPQRTYADGSEEDVARYWLVVGAVNFGSGWFPTLRKCTSDHGEPVSGATTVAWGLADRFRAHGPWTNAELRGLGTPEIAAVLGQRADHELMSLYSQALRSLGAFLGERSALDLVGEAGGSAVRLAEALAGGMALWADRGFYKRAQLLPADLASAGVARFADLDELTIFADNLVPHVLRCDGVLVYEEALAARIDRGELLGAGRAEREIRACAVHAGEGLAERLGIPARELDLRLWHRGQEPSYKARPRHRCRTVFY